MTALIIYHANCADGFTAAWVAHRALDGDVELLPAHYGDAPPDVTGRHVYVFDFSYPRAVLEEMHAKAASMLVLDHHKTAEAELAGLPYCVFDLARSGAGLTWDHFYPASVRPSIVDLVEDGDLWRFARGEDTQLFRAVLGSYDFTLGNWDYIDNKSLVTLREEGAAIVRMQSRMTDASVKTAVECELAGHNVLVTNLTTGQIISSVGTKLAEGRAFAATYFVRGDGKIVYSLRSSGAGIDVSEVATQFGGGGHRNAAGFIVDGFVHTLKKAAE